MSAIVTQVPKYWLRIEQSLDLNPVDPDDCRRKTFAAQTIATRYASNSLTHMK